MSLDDDLSAVSKSDLRTMLNECRQAQAAERVAQREAMKAGAAAATDNDCSFYAAQIRVSETAIQKLVTDMASLTHTQARMAMHERASPAKTRPPASNPDPTSKSRTAFAKAEAELNLYLANSPIKDTIKDKEFVDAEIARTAPASPLHHAQRGPMVKRSRSTSPRGKPRAASPNFRKAIEAMSVVSR